jgi:hypothetical protein
VNPGIAPANASFMVPQQGMGYSPGIASGGGEQVSLLTQTASPEPLQKASESIVGTGSAPGTIPTAPVREGGADAEQTAPNVLAPSHPTEANSVSTEQPNRPLHALVGVDQARHASPYLPDELPVLDVRGLGEDGGAEATEAFVDASVNVGQVPDQRTNDEDQPPLQIANEGSQTLPVTQPDKEQRNSFDRERSEAPEASLPHKEARHPRRHIEEWTSPPPVPGSKARQPEKMPVETKQELATDGDSAARYSTDREFQELMVDFLKLTSPGTTQSPVMPPDAAQSHPILSGQNHAVHSGTVQSPVMPSDAAQNHAILPGQNHAMHPGTVQNRAIAPGTVQSPVMPSDVRQSHAIRPGQNHAMHLSKAQSPVTPSDAAQSHPILSGQNHAAHPGTVQGPVMPSNTGQNHPIRPGQNHAMPPSKAQSPVMLSDARQSQAILPGQNHVVHPGTVQSHAIAPGTAQSPVMPSGAAQSQAIHPGTMQDHAMAPDTIQSHVVNSNMAQTYVNSYNIAQNRSILANTAQKHSIPPATEQTHANFSGLVQNHAVASGPEQSHAVPSGAEFDRERTGQRSEEASGELHQQGQMTSSVAQSNAQIIASRTQNALRAQPAPTPLPLRARYFLQPLVGIDLTGVRVHRGILAEQLTTSYQADAITVGNEVAIANGHTEETPETLGLLAHEFTHVARRSDPRFVPPIVRSGHISSTTMNLSPVTPFRSEAGTDPLPLAGKQTDGHPAQADEEALALQVENRVAQIAQGQIEQVTPFSTAGVDPDERRTLTGIPATAGSWNGLPAPWEPLPDWMTSLPPTMESPGGQPHNQTGIPTQAPVGTGPAPLPPTYSLGKEQVHGGRDLAPFGVVPPDGSPDPQTSWQGTMQGRKTPPYGEIPLAVDTGDSRVQRAGEERSQSIEAGGSTVPGAQPVVNTPEPDLDALAQQVHAILKRRLAVERRRAHH